MPKNRQIYYEITKLIYQLKQMLVLKFTVSRFKSLPNPYIFYCIKTFDNSTNIYTESKTSIAICEELHINIQH